MPLTELVGVGLGSAWDSVSVGTVAVVGKAIAEVITLGLVDSV